MRYGWRSSTVKGVDLRVPAGTVVGMLGPNGCGKSTLVRALGGITKPSAGTIRIADLDLRRLSGSRRAEKIAYVPQSENDSLAELTVFEAVKLGVNRNSKGTSSTTTVVETARTLGIDQWLLRRVGELSGGQRQRVAIARALAARTPFVLLDEPVSSLDLEQQVRIMELLVQLAADGVGVLVVLHDLNLAATFCEQLVVMEAGTIIARGTPAEVIEHGLLDRLYAQAAELRQLGGRPVVLPRKRHID